MNLLKELTERGIIQYTAEAEKGNLDDFFSEENRENKAAYIGADPSARSLHLGNYSSFIVVKWLAKAGYQAYTLAGGITGLIGDPRDPKFSGGNAVERKTADRKMIEENVSYISKQYINILNSKNVVNNIDFYADMKIEDYLRDIGKRINVGYLLAKDTIARRLETGISYAEFSYTILQGWDWSTMYFDGLEDKKFVKTPMLCQFGGADQWGNITTGMEFIRKLCNEKGVKNKACCFGIQLYLKPDGTKFGKSESGAIWLDEEMTSNYEFYQYLFNQPDDALKSLFLRFTMLSQEEINTILEQHIKEPFKHYGQKVFADTVTKDIRGESGLKEALEMTEAIFSGNLKNLNNKQFEMLINSSKYVLKLNNEINIIDALLNSNIVNSKSDAKRLIEQKSISVEDQLITDTNFVIKNNKEYTYIKKGKRDFIFIKFNK